MTPERRTTSDWIIWLVIGVLMLAWLSSVSQTFGPVIGFIGGLLGVLTWVLAVFKWVVPYLGDVHYRCEPFRVSAQREYPFDGVRDARRHMTAPIGETRLVLRVMPRRLTKFEEIHVRLVARKDWLTNNRGDNFPPRSVVGLDSMWAEGLVDNELRILKDHRNGFDGVYKQPYKRLPEDSLYLNLALRASESWHGFIMFQGERVDGHRGYGYMGLDVVKNA